MRVPKLKALMRERGLRNYSQLRKAELIELIRNNQRPLQGWESNRPLLPNRPPPPPPDQSCASTTQTWKPIDDRLRQPELEAGS